ncbi:tripartite tricarboxylate transporter TctB family protein [Paracoccus aerodenitrificans]|uniref:tripartite tricarboxylate transporter TctB family protein n=1 Tax=Paracoccus aerodenitrificans TaxID=3017781 RepID=UPI0022F02D38|nr:tripartite tricarboxylate transporter TctB family protein [Paracoccus aerodenitrificans]WBU65287.1 tripartite tricarboxylate transporter TctB family protein [Paracoccus aerodenitrificans]
MQRDWPDIWGGAVLAVTGLCVAIWSGLRLDFGTLRAMGPGFFPTVLGVALAMLGVAVAVPALRRGAEPVPVRLGDLAAVIASILIFGLGMEWLGMVPACFIAVLTASVPAPCKGWLWRLVLAVAVTAVTFVVFELGLQMGLPVWPGQ